MEKYFVTIRETLEKEVEVNAKSKADAEKQVRKMYDNWEIVLDSCDYISFVEFLTRKG